MPGRIDFSRGRKLIMKRFEPRAIFRFNGHGQGLNLFPGRAFIVKFGELLVFVAINGQDILVERD